MGVLKSKAWMVFLISSVIILMLDLPERLDQLAYTVWLVSLCVLCDRYTRRFEPKNSCRYYDKHRDAYY